MRKWRRNFSRRVHVRLALIYFNIGKFVHKAVQELEYVRDELKLRRDTSGLSIGDILLAEGLIMLESMPGRQF